MSVRASVLAVVSLLVVAGGVAAAPSAAPDAAVSPIATHAAAAPTLQQDGAANETTVTVSATGQAAAEPEVAKVLVTVLATADDAETARARVANDSQRMIDALRAAGIANESVRSTFYGLQPVYNRSRLEGFRAAQGFMITVDVTDAGLAVDLAVGNGADQVDSVEFTLTEETRRQLRRTALTRATDNARADAEAVASSSGLTITGVRSASTADVSFTPIGRVVESPTQFQPGPVTVVADVRVVYVAEPA